jgi:hypothetical protein
MAYLKTDGNAVVVTLNAAEALVALRREVRIPFECLRMVHVEQSPLKTLTFWRLPGMSCPGAFVIGCARIPAGREFAAAHAGQPAIVIDAEGGTWQRVVVSHPDAVALASDIAGLLLGQGLGGTPRGGRLRRRSTMSS